MKLPTRVEGPNLALRLIQPEDAAYVHGLRVNPAYSQHLAEVRGTAQDQRNWIETGAVITKGVTIGTDAIIVAGSAVTTDIPPYTIAGGILARVLKDRPVATALT